MNQSVSLLTSGGQSTPAVTEPKFPAATARSRAAAPFSSMLERAEYRAPERNNQNARSAKSNSPRDKDSRDESLSAESDRRPRVREKQKEEKTSDDQSLAGACAVNGQPVKLDESTPPTETGAEPQAVATPVSAQQSGSPSTNEDKAAPLNVPLTAEGDVTSETVFPTTTQAATKTESTPQTAEDLKSLLSPAASVPTPALAVATDVTTPNTSPISPVVTEVISPKETPPAAALETSTDLDTEVKSAAPASSAREAEVLLAMTTEEKAVVETALAAEPISDIVTATVAPEEARQVARAARRFRAESLETADGIGGAKSSETMKTVIKKEELAGITQQLLPGSSATPVATLTNLPGEARRLVATANSGAEALHAAGKVSPAPVRSDVSNTGDSLEVRAASPLPRVSELISREVRMFKRGGDDLVEVVLTPDTKTQISLRLQWREGQVEVQARCDFGDYSSLNNQWSQLQTSLATHGVRLSHLSERTTTGFTEFFNNPNFAQQQNRERQPDAPLGRPEIQPAAPAPIVKPGASTPTRRSNRLFDSWA